MLRTPCNTEEDIRLGFDWFLHKEPRAYVIIYKQTGEVIGNLTVYDRVPETIAARMPEKAGKAMSFALSCLETQRADVRGSQGCDRPIVFRRRG